MPMPQVTPRGRRARGAPQDAARRRRAGGEILRGDAGVARRRQGARLSRRPRPRPGDAAQIPPRLCAGGALRPQGASRRARHLGRGHGRGGPAGRRRRHPGALRPLPRPGDVSDQRSARPRHRLRRPRARKDAPAKYLNSPETPLFHKGATLYNIAAARAAAHKGAPVIAVEGYVDVIAMVTAGFEATVAPLGTALTADQLGAAVEDGRRADPLLRRRRGRPARRLSGGRSGAAAVAGPARACASPRCRTARIPTIWSAPAAARRSRTCSARRARSPRCCGCARPRPAASTRRSGAPRSRRGWARSWPRSATNRCADITAQDFGARLRQLFAPAGGRDRRRAATLAKQRRAGRDSGTPAVRRTPRKRSPRSRPIGTRAKALCGGEPATRREPDPSRPPRRHPAPRGADPAGGAQSSVAAARSSGGIRRGRVPPCRDRKLKAALIDIFAHAGRDATARPRLSATELGRADPRGFAELLGRDRARHHHAVGLGRAAGGGAAATFC